VELALSFFEKLVKIQVRKDDPFFSLSLSPFSLPTSTYGLLFFEQTTYAKSIEELCAGRTGKLVRLFHSKSCEPNAYVTPAFYSQCLP
jgi:hypothetical protein